MLQKLLQISLIITLFSSDVEAKSIREISTSICRSGQSTDYNKVSELREADVHNNPPVLVHTAGYYTPDDGGGATYRWEDTALHADDSCLYIKPNGHKGAGRYVYLSTGNQYNV